MYYLTTDNQGSEEESASLKPHIMKTVDLEFKHKKPGSLETKPMNIYLYIVHFKGINPLGE